MTHVKDNYGIEVEMNLDVSENQWRKNRPMYLKKSHNETNSINLPSSHPMAQELEPDLADC